MAAEPEFRDMRVCEADIKWVEEALYALYRHGEHDLAPKLMVLALRMRTGTGFSPDLPEGTENVLQFPIRTGHSVRV